MIETKWKVNKAPTKNKSTQASREHRAVYEGDTNKQVMRVLTHVHWSERRSGSSSFQAYAGPGKRNYLGSFPTVEEAALCVGRKSVADQQQVAQRAAGEKAAAAREAAVREAADREVAEREAASRREAAATEEAAREAAAREEAAREEAAREVAAREEAAREEAAREEAARSAASTAQFQLNDRVSVRWPGTSRGLSPAGVYCGRVISLRTELANIKPARMSMKERQLSVFRIAYDDGDVRWHHEGEVEVSVQPPQTDEDAQLIDCCLELQCVITKERLDNPAKGARCTHPPCCNFDALKGYAGRMKACPVAGCTARIQRTREVTRDSRLSEQLKLIPATVGRIWLHPSGNVQVRGGAVVESLDVDTYDSATAAQERMSSKRGFHEISGVKVEM